MKKNASIDMIETIAEGLGPLVSEVVFVGGATTGVYIDDPIATSPRPTLDVDCVIEITGHGDYYSIEDRLRNLGFKNVIGPKVPLCRWTYKNIIVDVMPTDPKILGFSNRWYPEAISQSKQISLPSSKSIRVFSLPYFIATKLEAFRDRGKGDYRLSSDLEDIVSVMDGAKTAKDQLDQCPQTVRAYLREQFAQYLSEPVFLEALESHLAQDGSQEARLNRITEILRNIRQD